MARDRQAAVLQPRIFLRPSPPAAVPRRHHLWIRPRGTGMVRGSPTLPLLYRPAAVLRRHRANPGVRYQRRSTLRRGPARSRLSSTGAGRASNPRPRAPPCKRRYEPMGLPSASRRTTSPSFSSRIPSKLIFWANVRHSPIGISSRPPSLVDDTRQLASRLCCTSGLWEVTTLHVGYREEERRGLGPRLAFSGPKD
jgi:hypothetical protein